MDFGRVLTLRTRALDARLVLVPNPTQHPRGDFGLEGDVVVEREADRVHLFRRRRVSAGAFRGVRRRESFRCCRCSSGRSRRGDCAVRSIGANGWTSARRIGWHGSMPGSAARDEVKGVRLTSWRKMSAMASLKDIPVVADAAPAPRELPRSGEKYLTPQGFTAIRDGIKAPAAGLGQPPGAPARGTGKPPWLRAKAPRAEAFKP